MIEKSEIIQKIRDAGADKPCIRCGTSNFLLVEGSFVIDQVRNVGEHPHKLPMVIFGCKHCGHLDLHALKILDPTA